MGTLAKLFGLVEKGFIHPQELRGRVIDAVGNNPGQQFDIIVELLDALAEHPSANVREAAATTFERWETARATKALVLALSDPEPRVREAAARALASGGEVAVGPLRRALDDCEAPVRAAAARALGQLANPEAADSLAARLDDADLEVQIATAVALGKLQDSRALGPLCKLLEQGESWDQAQVAEALGELQAREAVEPLHLALKRAIRDKQWSLQQSVVGALGKLGAAAFSPIYEMLSAESVGVRCIAARSLGAIRDARAIEPLCAALAEQTEDPDWRLADAEVAWAAVEALNRFGSRAVEPLCQRLGHPAAAVRRRASWALVQIGPRAGKRLCQIVADPVQSEPAKLEAALALGLLRDARASKALQQAVRQATGQVATAAQRALRQIERSKGGSPSEDPSDSIDLLTPDQSHRATLSRCIWKATPWEYNSARFLRLEADGKGTLVYAYGQTVYSDLDLLWELPTLGILRLTFFTRAGDAIANEIGYRLVEGPFSCKETTVGLPNRGNWTLECSQHPWPAGTNHRHDMPRVFYGIERTDGAEVGESH